MSFGMTACKHGGIAKAHHRVADKLLLQSPSEVLVAAELDNHFRMSQWKFLTLRQALSENAHYGNVTLISPNRILESLFSASRVN
jgi:hypothetical protein